MELGDHPNARKGLPVTLGWKHEREDCMSMDMYRYMRSINYYPKLGSDKTKSSSSSWNRSTRGVRRLSSKYRREYLERLGRYTTQDFIAVIEAATDIQLSRMKNAEINDAALFQKLINGGEQASGAVFRWSGNMAGLALNVANTALTNTKAVANFGVNGTKVMANTAINGTKVVANTAINGTKTVANTAYNGTKAAATFGVNGTKTVANTAINGTKAAAMFGVNGTKTVANTAINGTKAVATFGVNGTKTVANTAINGTKAAAMFGVNGTKTVANMGVTAVGTSGKVLIKVGRSSGKGLVKAIALPVEGVRAIAMTPKIKKKQSLRRSSVGPGSIEATASLEL